MMREVPVTEVGAIDRRHAIELASSLRSLRTLGDVLAWARRLTPPRAVTEIITQDEYTHDVVIGLDERCYLVFDTT